MGKSNNNVVNETESVVKKATAKIASEAAKMAKAAATGTLHYYLIWKIVVAIVVILVCLILFIACMFDIVFHDLGFADADSYVTTMYEEETKNIDSGLRSLYGSSANSEIDSALTAIINEEDAKIQALFLEEKTVAEEASVVDTEWEEPYTTIRYNEPVIDKSSYDGFWSNQKYVTYFSPIIQNTASNDIIHWTENAISGNKPDITTFLVNQIANYEWFHYEELEDTVEVITEEHKVDEKYYYYYKYTGTSQYESYEDLYLVELEGKRKIYTTKLSSLGGGKTASQWRQYFQSSSNWVKKTEVEEVMEDIEITYITKNYKISMESASERIGVTGGYEYINIGDSEIDDVNEERMELGVKLLEAIDEGKYGQLLKAFLTGGVEGVKNAFKGFWSDFQKDFSYREFVKNSNVYGDYSGLLFNTGIASRDAVYAYLRAMGFTHEATCGIMGNIEQESTFNPVAVSSTGRYRGLFQLDPGRYGKLEALCSQGTIKAEPTSTKAQLDYLIYDIKNHCGSNADELINCLKTCEDVELATQEFCVGYEGCISTNASDYRYSGNIFTNHIGDPYQELGQRINYAKQFDQYYSQYKEDYSDLMGKSDIVDYACQWVGNRYVWGGNSLENGIDCSHFVWQVLKNTGHYSGGWVKSTYWKNEGTPVGSVSDMQPGDVIVWTGHVAIYIGDGKYVHASNSKPYPKGGIKISTLSESGSHSINNIIGISRFP